MMKMIKIESNITNVRDVQKPKHVKRSFEDIYHDELLKRGINPSDIKSNHTKKDIDWGM